MGKELSFIKYYSILHILPWLIFTIILRSKYKGPLFQRINQKLRNLCSIAQLVSSNSRRQKLHPCLSSMLVALDHGVGEIQGQPLQIIKRFLGVSRVTIRDARVKIWDCFSLENARFMVAVAHVYKIIKGNYKGCKED